MALSAIQMMHLADSALPVGGFAFSSGLEAAVKCGIIRTRPELVRYLYGALQQWNEFEIPFVSRFYTLGTNAELQRYDRMLLAAPMRKASLAQARGWVRIFSDLFPALETDAIHARFNAADSPVHYLPLFTLCLKAAGAEEHQISALILFTLLRDQMSAAVRLGLIGPSAAQSIQSEMERGIGAVLQTASSPLCRSTPMMDMAQMLHPSLYTKLFQN